MSSVTVQTAPAKCAVACDYCRVKKIKCDANKPCRSCVNHQRSTLCYYPPSNPRPRRSAKERHKSLQDKLQRAQALLEAAGLNSDLEAPETINAVPTESEQVFERQERQRSFSSYMRADHETGPNENRSSLPLSDILENTSSIEHRNFLPSPQESCSPTHNLSSSSNHEHRNSNTIPPTIPSIHQPRAVTNFGRLSPPDYPADYIPGPEDPISSMEYQNGAKNVCGSIIDNVDGRSQHQTGSITSPVTEESPIEVEVHGPGSYLSICSHAGIQWVSRRIGGSDFTIGAASLVSHVARSLKLQQSLKLERVPEPDQETAMKYVRLFFEESLEATVNIIHRPSFEARLLAHFEAGEPTDGDPAWYALRNVIYAFGSRLTQGKSWVEAQIDGWQYFQNALLMHSELIYSWSSMLAVQSLFCMALYVEGIGAPKLEYMLLSNAVRLAQAKGIHTQLSAPWNIPDADLQNRSWLFWGLYVYEKHISFRSRRPSILDDDDIDCPLPTFSPDTNPNITEFFRHAIYHAQLTSSVMKELVSVKSRRKSPPVKAKIVQDLDARLQLWRENLPNHLKPTVPLQTSNLPPGISTQHKIWIHCSYYSTLAAIHSVFACPWSYPALDGVHDSDVRAQIDRSTFAAAQAARNTILITRTITVDSAAPVWLTFLFPFMGMLNLFTYVLNFPLLPSVPGDIDLLDMGAGYFGYLGFSTLSQASVSFAKDLTKWAQAAVERARQDNCQVTDLVNVTNTGGQLTTELDPLFDFGRYNFDAEDWSSLFQIS